MEEEEEEEEEEKVVVLAVAVSFANNGLIITRIGIRREQVLTHTRAV